MCIFFSILGIQTAHSASQLNYLTYTIHFIFRTNVRTYELFLLVGFPKATENKRRIILNILTMKKDLKKDLIIDKAIAALKKQALKDEELKSLKGGGPGTGIGQTTGMWYEPD